jgi:hypothetical protein
MPGIGGPFWDDAPAAGVLVVGGFEAARSSTSGRSPEQLRSEHAQPRAGVPPDLVVLASSEGKLFHVAGCTFIHDKAHVRTMVAREAEREGYAPCVRCLVKYLS